MIPSKPFIKKTDSTKGGGLVQFRADDQLLSQLSKVASHYNLPVGALSRLWVTERLKKELSQDLDSINKWLAERHKTLSSLFESEYEDEPIQAIHLVPFNRPQDIRPEDMRRQQGLLPPAERVDEYSGKINLEGYTTIKRFGSTEKPTAYVQVFRSGELESVRILRHDNDHKFIPAERVDSDLIHSVWSYSMALEALDITLPILLQISFAGMKGFSLGSRKLEEYTTTIEVNAFQLPTVQISDWSQVKKLEGVAELMHRSLDTLWNAAGLPRSYSYSASGVWLGTEEAWGEPKREIPKVNSARKEIIDLSGINPTLDRLDLIMHYDGRDYLVGKVRLPFITPDSTSEFACRVYQNDMEPNGKTILETVNYKNEIVEFTVGNLNIKGKVHQILEGHAGGAYNGKHLPLERDLMLSFLIQPI